MNMDQFIALALEVADLRLQRDLALARVRELEFQNETTPLKKEQNG